MAKAKGTDIRSFFSKGASKPKSNPAEPPSAKTDEKPSRNINGHEDNNNEKEKVKKTPVKDTKKDKKTPVKDTKKDKKTPVKQNKKEEQSKSKNTAKSPKVTKEKTPAKSLKTEKTGRKKKAVVESDEEVCIIDDSEEERKVENKKGKKKEKESVRKSSSKRKKVSDSEDESPVKIKKSSKSKITKVSESEDDDNFIHQTKKTKKKQKVKKSQQIASDSESEEPKPKKERQKRQPRKKREVVYEGSEDEELRAKKQSPIKAFFKSANQSKTETPVSKKLSASPAKKTPVSVLDFFGGAAVQRSDRKTFATKRKAPEEEETPKVNDGQEQDIHEDNDFAKTLERLDEKTPQKRARRDSSTAATPNSQSSRSTPRKTPSKACVISETPVRQSPRRPESRSSTPQIEVIEDTPIRQSPRRQSSRSSTPSKGEASPVRQSPRRQNSTSSKESSASGTSSLAKKLAAKAKAAAEMEDNKKSEKKSKTPVKADKKTPAKEEKKTPAKTEKKTPVKQSKTPDKAEEASTPATLERSSSTTNYRGYLTRAGPQALGTKEIPQGAENCLEGLTFVITGVLESIERDDAKSLIEKHGGKVTGSVSKRTSYMVAGRDAGNSKMTKAEQCGTKILDEDALFELIRSKPGKKSKYEIEAEKKHKQESQANKLPAIQKKQSPKTKPKTETSSSQSETSKNTSQSKFANSETSQSTTSKKDSDQSESVQSLLWVDKYKPTSMKQIIGQQGDKSNAKKLFTWLKNWHRHRSLGTKAAWSNFGRQNDDGGGHKAALLSGPPGIGKTTTAQVVCKEAGFSFVELNASDTRSKKSLQQEVAEALGSHTLVDFFGTGHSSTGGHNHCLIMDEVDGMAGNEDRGGIQELVQLIKNSKIPIICMCNDRNHPKMRTLANYCFDLRFYKIRIEQIKGAMMSLAFKEGLKIPPPALNEIITAANHDIRQVIHNLSMWSARDKAVTYEMAKEESQKAKKDMKMGPFDICKTYLVRCPENSKMTLLDKQDLFFQDYDITPLFIQENYLSTTPEKSGYDVQKHLDLVSKAADSISDGDLVAKGIRGGGNWSLLPAQSFYSSVIPAEYVRGGGPPMMQFPSWLGKNSSKNKVDRILQELRTHMRLKISANKEGLNMEYLPHFRNSLTAPLIKQENAGVPDVLNQINEYDLLKEDFDNILEVSSWPGQKDPMSMINKNVKAAFTRAYNKEAHMTPYSTNQAAKKTKRAAATEEYGDEEGNGEEDEEEEDLSAFAVKKAKPKAAAKAKASDTAKGKGKGKGKGKK